MDNIVNVNIEVSLDVASYFVKVDGKVVGEINYSLDDNGWSSLLYDNGDYIILTNEDDTPVFFEDIEEAIGAITDYSL